MRHIVPKFIAECELLQLARKTRDNAAHTAT